MVLPAGTTFSIRRSLLSNSSGALSLLVTTSTNGSPALTLISSGEKRLFSIVIGISLGSAARTAVAVITAARIMKIAAVTRRVIEATFVGECAVRELGIPKTRWPVNLLIERKAPCVIPRRPLRPRARLYTTARGPGGLRLRPPGRRHRPGADGEPRRRAPAGDRPRG